MRLALLLALAALLLSPVFAAIDLKPYLYATEKAAPIDYISFDSGNNTTAKIVKISNDEAMLLVDDKIMTDKNEIAALVTKYYTANFYPSSAELYDLKGYADRFNKSRNYMTRYGPAEQQCFTSGTHLDVRPCNDMTSCMNTASLICTLSGAQGCTIDVLAVPVLEYKRAVDKLNEGYSKFESAYLSFGPSTIKTSLDSMDAAFDMMKAGADSQSQSKLRYTDPAKCRDCIGICAEPKLDYASITSGKSAISSLRTKTSPFNTLEATAEKISLSTTDRINYRQGEEKAVIFAPKYNSMKNRYGGLRASAVEAKALVADSNFVSAANSFLDKADSLDQKFEKRDFAGFDALLSSYDSAGKTLSFMINNSTAPYRKSLDAQDEASDRLLEAQWSVNRVSTQSVDAYNSLANRKNTLDGKFKPPMTSAQYESLTSDYVKLASDEKVYLASQTSLQESVFGAGNAFGRASVDGAMSLAASMMPISFKTRQSVAKYVPPIVLAVIDLSLLAAGLLAFIAVFYYFHGFFKSKLALSGWVLALLGFVFILVVGSAGFYSIALSAEKYTTFSEFYSVLKASDRAAVVVDENSASDPGVLAMRNCADQIQAQLAAAGKKTYKYHIKGTSCTALVPKPASANSTNNSSAAGVAYERTTKTASECLDNMPDMPTFDLQANSQVVQPTFTTVVTKQAIFKGPDSYYAKKPMCDPANVIG